MCPKYITDRRWDIYPGRRQPPLRGWLVYEGLIRWLKSESGIGYNNLFLFFSHKESDKIIADSFVDKEKKENIVRIISEQIKNPLIFDTILERFESDTAYLDEYSISIRESPNPKDPITAFETFCSAWIRFAPSLLYIIFMEEALEKLLEDTDNRKPRLMLEKLARFRDKRKRIYDRCWYDDSKEFLDNLGALTGLGKDIEWVTPDIVSDHLKCGNERKRHEIGYSGNSALIYYNENLNRLSIEYGAKADLLKSKITIASSGQYVMGKIACKGHAIGFARMISPNNMPNNMRPGDIIISKMTTPDLVNIMKLASAIVTDEGGITSHASVISREYNIPCIVGTGNATQVFHDGDRIEVDANKGIARKLQ